MRLIVITLLLLGCSDSQRPRTSGENKSSGSSSSADGANASKDKKPAPSADAAGEAQNLEAATAPININGVFLSCGVGSSNGASIAVNCSLLDRAGEPLVLESGYQVDYSVELGVSNQSEVSLNILDQSAEFIFTSSSEGQLLSDVKNATFQAKVVDRISGEEIGAAFVKGANLASDIVTGIFSLPARILSPPGP